jgi:hypothetical protein
VLPEASDFEHDAPAAQSEGDDPTSSRTHAA